MELSAFKRARENITQNFFNILVKHRPAPGPKLQDAEKIYKNALGNILEELEPIEEDEIGQDFNIFLDEILHEIAKQLEESVLSQSKILCSEEGFIPYCTDQKFINRYQTTYNHVFSAIQNSKIVENIIYGSMNLEDIARKPIGELCPDSIANVVHEIDKRKNVQVEKKFSTRYRCRKCGTSKTQILEYQGRAVDEASSFSVKCVECDFVWRI